MQQKDHCQKEYASKRLSIIIFLIITTISFTLLREHGIMVEKSFATTPCEEKDPFPITCVHLPFSSSFLFQHEYHITSRPARASGGTSNVLRILHDMS